MQSGADTSPATGVQLQRVRGDEQDLKEDKQVEQVAGEESAIDAEQLHLKQHMEVRTALVVAGDGVQQAGQGKYRGEA